PACGEASRFWCTCRVAGAAPGQSWPVCSMVTTTLPPVSDGEMLTEVITTTEPQLGDDEALSVSVEVLVALEEPSTAPAGELVSTRNNPATAATRTASRPLPNRSSDCSGTRVSDINTPGGHGLDGSAPNSHATRT